MSYLIVPDMDEEPWPTLGEELCDFLEERAVFGPGDLAGNPAEISDEKRALIYRFYEVYPKKHRFAGRRRFKRCGWCVRKGMAKTELEGWIAYAELHPEAPVRCDGYDAHGNPVGKPVQSPYIPMLAYSKDQVEELAYGVLKYVCEEGPDADLFDVSLERTVRLSSRGREDGKALPLAQSPNALDGARTTFQAFDEPHRLYLPRIIAAHETMANNLTKRPGADAWSLYVGTAGELGQGSIAEDLHKEAEAMRDRKKDLDPRFFYFHRDSGPVHHGDKEGLGHNLKTKKGRLAAIKEATGPDGEYGPGQFDDIAELYTRPKTDRAYYERVQLNRWVQSSRQAFDPALTKDLTVDEMVEPLSFVTAGFDGARFKDATAIVIADLFSGVHQMYAMWERPLDLPDDVPWEVDANEVNDAVDQLFLTYRVLRWNGDPPHRLESHATWAGKHPEVEEWFTQHTRRMAYAVDNYQQGRRDGTIKYALDPRPYASHVENETMGEALRRHVGNAGKRLVNIFTNDEDENGDAGRQLHILEKIEPDRKFDAVMADILANEGRLDVLSDPKALAQFTGGSTTFKRLR
jgi:hypothetical protein